MSQKEVKSIKLISKDISACHVGQEYTRLYWISGWKVIRKRKIWKWGGYSYIILQDWKGKKKLEIWYKTYRVHVGQHLSYLLYTLSVSPAAYNSQTLIRTGSHLHRLLTLLAHSFTNQHLSTQKLGYRSLQNILHTAGDRICPHCHEYLILSPSLHTQACPTSLFGSIGFPWTQ